MRGNEYINGHPIRCYDSGPKYADRYCCYFMDIVDGPRGEIMLVGMSENPFHPQGFGQHSNGRVGSHNGRRVPFGTLPPDCQQLIRQELQY